MTTNNSITDERNKIVEEEMRLAEAKKLLKNNRRLYQVNIAFTEAELTLIDRLAGVEAGRIYKKVTRADIVRKIFLDAVKAGYGV